MVRINTLKYSHTQPTVRVERCSEPRLGITGRIASSAPDEVDVETLPVHQLLHWRNTRLTVQVGGVRSTVQGTSSVDSLDPQDWIDSVQRFS